MRISLFLSNLVCNCFPPVAKRLWTISSTQAVSRVFLCVSVAQDQRGSWICMWNGKSERERKRSPSALDAVFPARGRRRWVRCWRCAAQRRGRVSLPPAAESVPPPWPPPCTAPSLFHWKALGLSPGQTLKHESKHTLISFWCKKFRKNVTFCWQHFIINFSKNLRRNVLHLAK